MVDPPTTRRYSPVRELELNLVLVFRVPEDGLTVNGILLGLEEQTPLILNAVLQSILKALEERTVQRLIRKHPGRFVLNGHQPNARKLITHFGVVRYRMVQMIDKKTGKTVIPLAKALALVPYRQYQAEALRAGVGLAIHLSYARATREIVRIRGQGPSKSTTYRWFREIACTQCRWPSMKDYPYRFLMVDGTKVRLQGPGGKDLGYKEMRGCSAASGMGSETFPFFCMLTG